MAAARSARPPSSPSRVRWDRIGRVALLCVLAFVLFLYISPLRSWVTAMGEAKERRAQVAELRARNDALRARERELERPSALEREARRLGMVKAGERAYVIEGLPK